MGAACCSDGGRCQRQGPGAEGEIGLGPSAPEDSVHVAAAAAVPAARSGPARARPPGAGRFPPKAREVPRFGAPAPEDDLASSCSAQSAAQSSLGTAGLQQEEARALVKGFVREMVKGREVTVLAPSGELKSCSMSLSRGLDALKIKMGAASRRIVLREVDEILAGAEDVKDISTPLDELCATLFLASGDAISFRMHDVEERDTFILCLTMFADKLK